MTQKTKEIPTIKRLQVMSELMGRANLASRLGEQYGGDRDVYEALGYPKTIEYRDYLSRYSRQDMAKAVINRPVNYTWKGAVTVSEKGQKDETAMEKAWVALEKQLKLKSKFVRLDKLSSIGSYGVLLLGFDDVKKPEDFEKAANKKVKLVYVKPLGQGSARISNYVNDPRDPRYGQPEYYLITYARVLTEDVADSAGDAENTISHKVHHSRVLHVAQELLESEVKGEPVLKSVWNRLMDLEKLVGGSAEMFWRGARPGYQGKIGEDYTLTTEEEEKLKAQLDEYENNMRRILLNSGVEFEALQTQVSDPSAHVDVQIQMISAVTGIPKRVLTGSERGELASGQDIIGWYAIVQTRREEHAESNIIRPFIDYMIDLGVLPPPVGDDYNIGWTDLFSASEKDQAEVGRIRATAIKEYTQNPLAQYVMPPEAFMKHMMGLNESDREEIAAMSSGLMDIEAFLDKMGNEGGEGGNAGPTPVEGEE